MSLYRKYNFASPELETGPKSAPSLGIQELGLACVAGACWFTFFYRPRQGNSGDFPLFCVLY